jgi:hypothetical protein
MLKRSAWVLILPLTLSVACGDKDPADTGDTADGDTTADDAGETGGVDDTTGTDSTGTDTTGDGTTGDTSTGDGDGTVFVGDTGDGDYECPNGEIPSMVPVTMMGTVDDGFMMMNEMFCDEAGGQEVVWTWTAPSEGFFKFDTIGSAGNTTLYVRDAEGDAMNCDGPVIACGGDIDFMTNPQTEIATYLTNGQIVQVVVDHAQFASPGTAIVLNIDEIAGATCDLTPVTGTLPITVSGDTSTSINSMTGSCFGEGPDLRYTWTAPADAQYRFTTNTDPAAMYSYDTVLYLLDGHGCDGDELACNDDVSLGMERDSIIRIDLTAGQEVTIVVDGWSNTSGPFDLLIEEV